MSPPIRDPNEQTAAYMLAEIRRDLADIKSAQAQMNHLLTGNGEPAKGIIVRLDRLEQSEARRNWFTGAAITAACGALVTAVWNKLSGGNP